MKWNNFDSSFCFYNFFFLLGNVQKTKTKRKKKIMKTSRRSQSREGGRKNLPSLTKQSKSNVTLGEVQQIRLKIQKMELEKTQIRSKKNRMKQIIHERNAEIDQVLRKD